jgi:23S rRNA (adenine2503-C2)-methyltransferase
MTNISKETYDVRMQLVINHIKVDTIQRSDDGTIKNAVRLHDGLVVESVLIPTNTRTACVSSQVGCSLDCSFCYRTIKRMRNLEPGEIYDQVLAIDKESRLYYNHPYQTLFYGNGRTAHEL